MVIVDKLFKETHFGPIKSMHKASDMAQNFMKKVFQLHGFPKAIVLDRDNKFTS